MQALKVSHPTLNQICEILKSFGLSGKLTGAGGGGYAIALVPPNINEGKLFDVTTMLKCKGFEVIFTKLGGTGVQVE